MLASHVIFPAYRLYDESSQPAFASMDHANNLFKHAYVFVYVHKCAPMNMCEFFWIRGRYYAASIKPCSK
ncbi:hypothetical protein WN48_08867 [Eufriesea mexicana]|uniref:Uncharacterized protein n=1 Tax=Eufriesea mexicana TaxID=516756 RepID=A0A310SEW0_9HYME|nr:hypothetical protein WN48_08867 [Eufriesea mexicana]